MSIIRRRKHEVPSLNTASLPDLIFAILFFFMIVTHMRKVNLKVRYKTPQGTELTHLSRKTNTTYIFIGQPVGTTQSLGSAQSQQDAAVCIQVNDKVVSLDELSAFLQREQRQARKSGEAQQLTVCLKADRHAPMRVVEGVKMALRKANMLHVNYYATEKAPSSAANP